MGEWEGEGEGGGGREGGARLLVETRNNTQ